MFRDPVGAAQASRPSSSGKTTIAKSVSLTWDFAWYDDVAVGMPM
jgi:hypothetical protein